MFLVILGYYEVLNTDSRRKEVEKLLPNIFKYVSTNEL